MSTQPLDPWKYAVSSQGAGALSTLLFYPLDVVKTRFMAQDGTEVRKHNGIRYHRVVPAMRTMVQQEGVGSLFRGSHVAVGASAVSWGAYMLVYRALEQHVNARQVEAVGPFGVATACGLCAGAVVNCCTNPLWLVKARMQLAKETDRVHYSSITRATAHIVRTDGISCLWRGTTAQMLTGVPNSLQYPLYEAIKRFLLVRRQAAGAATSHGKREEAVTLNGGELLLCTVASKFSLAVVTHPLQVLKARLMDQRSREGDVQYRSLASALRTTVTREGVVGLFRGFHVGLAHTVPRNVVQFGLYEVFMRYGFACRT